MAEDVLRQAQQVQLRLLEIFERICSDNSLQYWLEFGTMLGALRHNGFIPWDDDLDVAMPQKDYLRFLKIAAKELPKGVLLQYAGRNGGVSAPIARLRDCHSFYAEAADYINDPCGIFIDIYPTKMEPRFNLSILNFLFKIGSMAWSSVFLYTHEPSRTVGAMIYRALKALVWKIIYLGAVGVEKSFYIFGRGAWRYPLCVSKVPFRVSNDQYFPLRKQMFEGKLRPIPNRAEELLEYNYGDWRKLPPESERNPDKKMKLILPDRAPKVWWAVW